MVAGSLGPRLAGRLTAELILRSPQYMSCINFYELDLRGNKIGSIENLGAAENQFDSIDLSDNAVVKVEGFPKMHRLKCLVLNNNRISRIAKGLEASIPNLEILVLTNNKISNLQDIDPLSTMKKLRILSLLDNPVTKKPGYRLYVISRIEGLKALDFRKVKLKEKQEAAQLFGSAEKANEYAVSTFAAAEEEEVSEAANQPSAAQQEAAAEAKPAPPSAEQLTAIKAAIANAQTLEEVRRLEEALRTGHMPSEFSFSGSETHANGANQDQMQED